MGLYQRDLTSFREKPVIRNQHVEENCVNCHSFGGGDSENFLFHIRGSVGGTMIKKGDEIYKVNLKSEETLSAGVYPAWHPSGDYIAFSTNKIEQYFHAGPGNAIEVVDRQSDLVLYHTETNKISHVPGTKGEEHMETYPCWSPDGTSLYFSRSDADANTPFDSIRYDIYRISFQPENETFGRAEPVFLASERGLSASFPRISPDGRYLLCTVHNFGTFPIWHREADLCLIDLQSGIATISPEVNSNDTESFHSWSKNSRWIVFSSRRDDGQYTKPYLCYLSESGKFHKPFLLPQRSPEYYLSLMYSFNRPELINSSIEVNPRRWIRVARRDKGIDLNN
jgi:Tol biopolymer transport system component